MQLLWREAERSQGGSSKEGVVRHDCVLSVSRHQVVGWLCGACLGLHVSIGQATGAGVGVGVSVVAVMTVQCGASGKEDIEEIVCGRRRVRQASAGVLLLLLLFEGEGRLQQRH